MHSITINRGLDVLIEIKIEGDGHTQSKRIMGENEIRLQFKLDRYVDFTIGDWCEVFDEIYKIQPDSIPNIKKINIYSFEYSIVFKAEGFDLMKSNMMFFGENDELLKPDFSLMGTPLDFINLIVKNALRTTDGWAVGQVIPAEPKNLDFKDINCYNALSYVAEQFETEFWLVGKTIHLTKIANDTGLVYKQGRQKGLYEITKVSTDSTSVITRLYVYGSEKNIPEDYRNNTSKRLRMTNGDFIERNSAKYGLIEAIKVFDDVYPHRTGTVTGVSLLNQYKFIDSDIDFNLNDYLLPGVPAKLTFNTGKLKGYTFELATPWNNEFKEFTLIKNKEETTIDIPNEFDRPTVGDEYVLTDIKMPQSYIDEAELALYVKGVAYSDIISQEQNSFLIEYDPTYLDVFKKYAFIGDIVKIVDADMRIEQTNRIISTVRNLVEESKIKAEISSVLDKNAIAKLQINLQNNTRDLDSVTREIRNGALYNNRIIGEFFVDQLPRTNTNTGFSALLVENSTGKLFIRD